MASPIQPTLPFSPRPKRLPVSQPSTVTTATQPARKAA